MPSEIESASAANIPHIVRIFSECADWLSAQGMRHWVGHHSDQWVSNALSKFEVFVHKDGELTDGVLMLREGRVSEIDALGASYFEGLQFKGDPFLWICKVAVLPRLHRTGVGSKLLEHAESLALNRKYKTCVLDAVTKNGELLRYYERRGYKALGLHHDCTIFEKELEITETKATG